MDNDNNNKRIILSGIRPVTIREGIEMNAYEIMREWDREAGLSRRTDEELDIDIPGSLTGDYADYAEWKDALEINDVAAIIEGRSIWGLPIFC